MLAEVACNVPIDCTRVEVPNVCMGGPDRNALLHADRGLFIDVLLQKNYADGTCAMQVSYATLFFNKVLRARQQRACSPRVDTFRCVAIALPTT